MHTLGGGPRVPTERAMCTARRSETKRHGVSDLAPLWRGPWSLPSCGARLVSNNLSCPLALPSSELLCENTIFRSITPVRCKRGMTQCVSCASTPHPTASVKLPCAHTKPRSTGHLQPTRASRLATLVSTLSRARARRARRRGRCSQHSGRRRRARQCQSLRPLKRAETAQGRRRLRQPPPVAP